MTEDEMTYTVVPDIHADLERLSWSIDEAQGSKMIFLGDLIDAGKLVKKPNDLGILQRVSQLISDGHASCILGNHELNAILFHRLVLLQMPHCVVIKSKTLNSTKASSRHSA
jgi:hypothetical protein